MRDLKENMLCPTLLPDMLNQDGLLLLTSFSYFNSYLYFENLLYDSFILFYRKHL